MKARFADRLGAANRMTLGKQLLESNLAVSRRLKRSRVSLHRDRRFELYLGRSLALALRQ